MERSDLDRGLCEIGRITLERDESGTFVEVAQQILDRSRVILRRCGVESQITGQAVPRSGSVPGSSHDLEPLRAHGIADRISLRSVDTAEATRLTRRGVFSRYDAERLRPLLRGLDRAYAWRRVIWMPRAMVRAPALRGVRPIVFDRAALTAGKERWGFALAESLARWVAG